MPRPIDANTVTIRVEITDNDTQQSYSAAQTEQKLAIKQFQGTRHLVMLILDKLGRRLLDTHTTFQSRSALIDQE